MQEDNFDLFDDRVRSLLDGAEVKAPRGVWRAVRGTLDAAASWWRYAAAGLVAACLLAGGLFLGGVFDRSADMIESPAVAQAVSETPVPEAVEESVAEPEPEAAPVFRSVARKPASPRPAEVLVARVDEPEDKPEEESVSEKSEPAAPAKESVSAEPWSDPFAAMALEDRLAARGKSRVSLAMLGVAGGNDSDLGTYLGRAARMADGSDRPAPGLTEQSASSYGIPVSVGLGVRYNFNDRLSLGTGITWTMLYRKFTGAYSGSVGETEHTMHYVGVPLNLYFNAIRTENMKFYVFGGGSAEYCVSNKYNFHGSPEKIITEPVKGLQYSVAAGLGVEFKLSDRLGVYFDPSARYYPHSDHPRSVRTDKPFMVNFEAGLRLNL